MSLINDFDQELAGAIDDLLPALEGAEDLARALTTKDGQASADFVAVAIQDLKERLAVLVKAREALYNLTADGYPEPLVYKVQPKVDVTLNAQESSIENFLSRVSSVGEAVSAEITLGSVTPL